MRRHRNWLAAREVRLSQLERNRFRPRIARCETRETTNLLLFGSMLGLGMELPFSDWAGTLDRVSLQPQEISAAPSPAPKSSEPVELPIDDMHFVEAPSSEPPTRRAMTQEITTAPANPATYQFDLLASEFTDDASLVATRIPESPPPPSPPTTQGLPARNENPPKPTASSPRADMPAPTSATFAPASGQSAQQSPAAEPVLAQEAELNDGEGEGPMTSVMDGGGGECDCQVTPLVRLEAIDPTASAWARYGDAHGTSTGAFEVRRTGDLELPLTVWYTVLPESTAVAGSDYQELYGYVDIPAGQRNAGILVEPIDAANENAGKSVIIQLDWSPDYLGEGAAATVSINESISPDMGTIQSTWLRPDLHMYSPDPNAAELPDEVSTGLYLVERMGLTIGIIGDDGSDPVLETDTNLDGITVNYTHTQPPGQASGDYQGLSGSVPLPQGVFGAEIILTPIEDFLLEGPELVTVSITPSSSYDISFNASAAVGIQDDERYNESPVAYDDEYEVTWNSSPELIHRLEVEDPGILWNDFDPDGDPFYVIWAGGAEHAAEFSWCSCGGFVYVPEEDFVGEDEFEYLITDGIEVEAGTVTIDVVNHAPVAEGDYYEVGIDEIFSVEAPGVLGNDYDPDEDPLLAFLEGSMETQNGRLIAPIAAGHPEPHMPRLNFN